MTLYYHVTYFAAIAHLNLTPGEGAVALTTDDGVELSIPPSIVLKQESWSQSELWQVNLLSKNIVAVGDKLVAGFKEAEELHGSIAFPLDHRVVLHHHRVRVHSLCRQALISCLSVFTSCCPLYVFGKHAKDDVCKI